MFWHVPGLSAASPVDTILDKENFKLEDLLDEDEIIQECKALNTRLINFLRDKVQVELLLRYIVEETPEDAEKKRIFRFPFIACEIFICEVDVILKTLVEDEDLMNLLFSFLKPDHPHGTLLAGYFGKVVICLMMRKTLPLMNYVKSHPEIVSQLVDLIGITSIMEVLIRLIGADETMYSSYSDSMQWLDDIQVLEMIVDKFSSSDSAEVHANAAEILCAVTRYAPPALATKISSPSFVGRLFHHAFEDSRPKSVLVHSLSVCISLLDPKRLVSASYQAFRSQLSHGTLVTASPETVNGMLDSLGDLLKLLDVSSAENILPTTYGSLHPPLGKHRLKIVEFISVLLSIGSEVAEMRLINLGAIKHVIDLFFEYPFNNFLHHHVENIIVSCLESKEDHLIGHVLEECKLVTRILEAEKNSALSIELTKRTLSSEGRTPPRVGFVGHITRIANKLIQLANINSAIHSHLQQNSGWAEWHASTLTKRNTVENVYQWACGRPTSMQDRGRDSDDEDFRDRDYDVAALASNLSQAFKYGIYPSEDVDEAQASQERDDEDVYFDDEAAEVVINSLRLGDDPDSGSLFTNSNWFAFDEDKALNDGPEASPSANLELPSPNVDDDDMDEVILGDPIEDTKGSDSLLATSDADLSEGSGQTVLSNGPVDKLENDIRPSTPDVTESPTECVEWTEEDAEPGEVSENTTVLSSDIRSEKVTDAEPREVSGNTAVLSSEVGSEKVMDATDGVMPGTGQVGAEQGSENFVESLAPDTTIEKTLPHSPDVNSTGHSEPAANLESPLGEEKQEKEESREK
ncbi:serine/threonine-protein phosphatase 6 regulatory subunit 3-like [Hordeum vulgare subsp. vulgare]|uniref:Serine/threonine-protein phosphatase 6 regulatory subunit n=1 Tax=Hordeum vulgare subsp. vulgare TaxID=112509 RepID=A0A8I6X746_HORVV|nr:serine/threonine-protein phosphatase 6 regulatory subunit 3-like [Hordeum vulgare subsp. vulgare]XP_044967860.1 serine/threonine-protein phosphatase 6 regulatory subunit 3-like [Hordeum vulgare subsp. vulgare]